MTVTATPEQIARFRRKIADQKVPPTFPEPELQDIWDEAGGDLNKACLIAFEELAANAAKFTDYTANESSQKKSQIFDHLTKVMIPMYQEKVRKPNQVRIVGTAIVPTRRASRPYTDPNPDNTWPLWNGADDE